ncbi:hypothetical protein Tco_0636794 [Tanacetum coccineum]
MMSSPNHPTSDIEDAFSSNFPDYIPASPDYFTASPGNTYSSSSNNSFSLVLIASPTLSLFHDDPYMKVMQAFYAKESPIPPTQALIAPPTVLPSSPVLSPSPMFDPQDFFLPEEILPPQKRAHFLSSSSTNLSTRLKLLDFRKQIGHNDEVVLARVRTSTLEILIEDIQVRHQSDIKSLFGIPPKRTSTSAAPAMTQAAIRKLVAHSFVAALEHKLQQWKTPNLLGLL